MSISDVIAMVNEMEKDGVIERYAIGGAVGATFYLEPVATLDVDVTARGCGMKGEYIMIGAPYPSRGPSPARSRRSVRR